MDRKGKNMGIKPLATLAQAFNDWKVQNNINSDISEMSKYIWEIPENALDFWMHELDDRTDVFTEHVLNTYRDMFHVGHRILGIVIGGISTDTKIRLYKLSEAEINWSFEQVLCSDTINILTQNNLVNNILMPSGYEISLPMIIKPDSLQILSEQFDLTDGRISTLGLCAGQEFKIFEREQNRLLNESWLGTINYQTGDFHIVRSNLNNEKKFEKYYRWLKYGIGYGGGLEQDEDFPIKELMEDEESSEESTENTSEESSNSSSKNIHMSSFKDASIDEEGVVSFEDYHDIDLAQIDNMSNDNETKNDIETVDDTETKPKEIDKKLYITPYKYLDIYGTVTILTEPLEIQIEFETME